MAAKKKLFEIIKLRKFLRDFQLVIYGWDRIFLEELSALESVTEKPSGASMLHLVCE
jgi:hypothetical protein